MASPLATRSSCARGWRNAAGCRRFERRYPGAVGRAAVLGVEVAFDLQLVAPDLPPFPVSAGHDEMSFLTELTWAGAATRYGTRDESPRAYAQLEHELDVIKTLDVPGYFLVVWDIVRFCMDANILCQGRGSAANSAVCYALGICHADPVKWNLLFERLLAPKRDGPATGPGQGLPRSHGHGLADERSGHSRRSTIGAAHDRPGCCAVLLRSPRQTKPRRCRSLRRRTRASGAVPLRSGRG